MASAKPKQLLPENSTPTDTEWTYEQMPVWFKLLFPARWIKVEVIAVGIIAIAIALVYYYLPITKTKVTDSTVAFKTEYVQDSSLELGQQQTRQNGENGTKETTVQTRHTLSGKQLGQHIVSEKSIKVAINQTVARGTKRYQYMWCSNGSYRYFSNDQFKDPNVGFTHQSQDYCAQSGAGHMTGLADTAPNPTYTYTPAPVITAPTYTHCYNTGLYSISIDCYSY